MAEVAQPDDLTQRSQNTIPAAPTGRLRAWRRGFVLIASLAVLPLAWSAAGGAVQAAGSGKLSGPDKATIGDAVGDVLDPTGTALDISRFEVQRRDAQMHLELEFASTISPADSGRDDALFGFVDLDTDQQASTGQLASVDYLTALTSGLGSDVLVDLATYSAVDGKMDVVAMDGDGDQVLGRAVATFEGRRLTLSVPLVWLGGDGSLSAAAAVGNSKAVTDVVPDGGFLATIDGGGSVLLTGGRFAVDVTWRDFNGASGAGSLVFQSDDSAVFWFFNADNWELMVKVIDGCAFNDRFWVFSAATTNVEFSVQVTDTVTGVARTYRNVLGDAAPAVTDTGAFATCGAGAAP